MKRIIMLLFGLFIALFVKGQENTDSLYLHLYNYHVIKGELKTGMDLNKLPKSFNIVELIDSVNTDAFRIFKFYHLEYEDALTSFLIIEKGNVEIYDILSFDILIERILGVSELSEELKTACIKEILKQLREYNEIADMDKLVIQKDFGRYHYFIPLVNLKSKEGVIK
jgi:hypothetical protein